MVSSSLVHLRIMTKIKAQPKIKILLFNNSIFSTLMNWHSHTKT